MKLPSRRKKRKGDSVAEPSRAADGRRAPGPILRRAFDPLDRAAFALQERVVWPLGDRVERVVPGRGRTVLGGTGAVLATVALAVGVALAASGGSSSSDSSTVAQAAPPAVSRPSVGTLAPPRARPPVPAPKPKPTLHGAKPAFRAAPRKDAGAAGTAAAEKDLAKVGSSEALTSSPEEAGAAEAPSAEATAGTTELSSPASDRISSDPKNSKPAPNATDARAAAAPAVVPDGPPAGPKALAVAGRFAAGFVVYETGGAEGEFKAAFERSASSQLTEALLKRPPRQPAGVKVPQAKVVNVVAGPSQGRVFKVSVSLLRVGVTSELRLDMEKTKRGGWRVTNVLG